MDMRDGFWGGFMKAARETPRQFFAPLTAVWFAATRRRGYIWHLRALYRM